MRGTDILAELYNVFRVSYAHVCTCSSIIIASVQSLYVPFYFKEIFIHLYNYIGHARCLARITGYGSTLYIRIAMVFVFSPYIRKFTSCFQFQVNLTFNDFTAQNMSPNISLNYHVLASYNKSAFCPWCSSSSSSSSSSCH